MSEKITLTIDTGNLDRAIRGLSQYSGRGENCEDAIVQITGLVLQDCLHHTKLASKTKIRSWWKTTASRIEVENATLSVNTGTRGGPAGKIWLLDKSTYKAPALTRPPSKKSTFLRKIGARKPARQPPRLTQGGRAFHDMTRPDRHWSDERWALYQSLVQIRDQVLAGNAGAATRLANKLGRKINLTQKLAAVGLSKKSWLQIADVLGIQLNEPGDIRNAKASNGVDYQDGTAERTGAENSLVIEIANAMPTVIQHLNGAENLRIAVEKRERAFDLQVTHGVFLDMNLRAKLYPGLFLTQ